MVSEERINAIIERTKKGGGEIVKLLGTSGWYAPGAAAAQMVESIVKNENRIFPVCAYLTGEYGLEDIYLGVPVKLDSSGISKIIELDLDADEKALLNNSASHVREVIGTYQSMNIS